jgi:predicted P-loop ATPase
MLKLSFFTSARDNQPKPLPTTWEDLAHSLSEPRAAGCTPETCKRSECTEKHGNAWSPASYPTNSPRARSAVEEVCALVLDIDHVPSDEALAEILDRIPYQRIIHASHSDKPGDRCIRVVVALSHPVQGSQWPQFWQAATTHLGVPVDQATKDASRLYFLPSRPQGATLTEYGDGTDYLYTTTPGPLLDVDAFLITPGDSPIPDVGVAPTFTPTSTDNRTRAVELIAHHWPSQGRHLASLSLAGALAHAGWPEEEIIDFMADVMTLVYPSGDPDARKRELQARDSIGKIARQEPVSGWPSLITHLTEPTVQEVMKLLGITQKPQWIQNLIAKSSGPVKPSFDQIKGHYKAIRSKLLRQRTNPVSQYEAKLLAKVLDHEQLAEADEDRTHALVQTLRTLIKWAPEQSTHDQLAQLLVHVFPVNVGQDADRAWVDTVQELLDQCAETIAQEAAEDGDFEIEVTGVRMGKPKNTLKNLDVALKKLNVKLRYDEFALKKIISRDGGSWEIFQDRHLKGLWLEIERKWDLGFSLDKWASYLDDQAYHNAFHPVRDYMDALEWDGTPRLDRWLHTYGQAPDTNYTRAIGRLVLVAAVRRIRQPGCKFDEMLILEGEQGAKKSSALVALCPDPNWFTDELPLGADSKRVIEATGGKFIVEAGELKGMSRRDVGELKGFLSRQVDEARMAFGREVRSAPRQFIVIGTTNDAQYLRDPTGNRRFWPVLIIEFDVDAILRDRDQLWAEAAFYESQGESIRLAPQYYSIAAEEQEERRVVDNIEAIIEEAFTGHVGRVKCLDLYMLLGKDPVDAKPDEQARVGDAMRRIGWKHTRRRIAGKLTYVYVKGDEHEQTINLAISGRKVVQAAQAPGSAPETPQVVKTN